MSELFIPPEGAMQFHVTRNPITNEPTDFCVWVWKAEPPNLAHPSRHQCECPMVYPVLPETISLKALMAGAHTGHRRVICTCAGRIIE